MTRIIRVETCDRCPYVCGSRGCRHPDALVEVAGVLTIRMFDDYFVIPDWCPLEQAPPGPATIDLYGPPRYCRSTTDDFRWWNLAKGLTGGRP